MSDVDERIVKMTFDNNQFEQNAKETMSTLDRLKEALNFKNTEKSFDKITEASNRVDVSNVTESAKSIQAEFSAMQVVAYTAISNITNRLMNFGHNIVSGAFSSLVQGGINRAFKVEKAKFNIQGLGKDWTKISNDITEAVQGTAYGFDEAAAAAASLAASDVVSTGDPENSPMAKGLKAIAGAAAMTGSSFSDISNIFTTVAGNGRILSQQLNQFSARGLNAAATLRDYVNAHEDVRKKLIDAGLMSTQTKKVQEFADSVKLTEGNIRTLVSASAVDFKTFSDAMSDAFGNQAKKADKTFSGVLANVKAALARIGQAFAQPLIANNDVDTMLNYVDGRVRNIINKTKDEVAKNPKLDPQKQFIKNMRETDKYAKTSTKTLESMFNKYYTLQNNFVGVLQGVKKVFLAIESGVKGSKFLEDFLKTSDKACQILILSLNTLAAYFTTVKKKGETLRQIEIFGKRDKAYILTFETLLTKLGEALGLAEEDFNNLKDTVKGVLDVFQLAWDIVTEFIRALIPAKGSFDGMGSSILEVTGFIGRMLTKFSEWVRESGFITTAAEGIRKAVSLIITPFRLAINFIGNFFKSIRQGNSPIQKFLKTVKSLWDSITKFVKSIKDAAEAIIDAFLKPFRKEEDEASDKTNIFAKALEVLTDAIEWLADKISGAADVINGFVEKFTKFDSLKEVGKSFSNTVKNKILPALDDALGGIKEFVTGTKFDKAEEAFDGLKTKATDSFESIKDIEPATILDTIKQKLLDGLDKIKNLDYASLFDKAKESFESFLEFLSDVRDKIGETLSNIGEAIEENSVDPEVIADKIVTGIGDAIDGVSTLKSKLIDKVAEVIKSTFDNLSDILPEPKEIGVAIGDFLAAVLQFVLDAIPFFVETIAFAIRTFVSKLPDMLTDFAKNIGESLDKALFEPLKIEIDGKVREIPTIFESFKEAFGKVVDNIGKEISDASLEQILKWVNLLFGARLINELRKTIKKNGKSFSNLQDAISEFLGRLSDQIDKLLGVDTGKKHWTDRLLTLATAIKEFAIALAILAGTLIVLGMVPTDVLVKGGKALALLGAGVIIFAAGLAAIDKYLSGGNLAGIAKNLGILAGGLAALTAALFLLSFAKEEGLGNALIAMGALLIEIGAFVIIVSNLAKDPAKFTDVVGSLSLLTGALAGMTISLVALSLLPADKMKQGLVGLGIMLAEIVVFMNLMPDSKGAIVKVLPLVLLLGSVVAALWILKKLEIEPSSLGWLGGCMLALSAAIFILSKIDPGTAAMGAVSLVTFVAVVIGLISYIGVMLDQINQLTGGGLMETVSSGLDVLGELLKKIGHTLGEFAVGIGDAVTEALPSWGENISDFLESLAPGLKSINDIGPNVGENMANITKAISSLTGAGLKTAITDFIGGDADFSAFGERFGSFIDSLQEVAEKLSSENNNIDDKALEDIGKVADTVQKLATVEKNLQSQGGLKEGIFGSKSFTKFITGVKKLFKGFSEISATAGEIKNIDDITKITEAAKSLSDVLASLPDEKKSMYWLDANGSSKLSSLAKDLVVFSSKIKLYVDTMSNIDTSSLGGVAKDITSSLNQISKAASSKKVASATASLGNIGGDAMKQLSMGFAGKGAATTIATSISGALTSALKSIKTTMFQQKGKECSTAFANGISSGLDVVKNAGSNMAKAAGSAADNSAPFRSAGANAARGYAAGVTSRIVEALAAIRRMVSMAQAEARKLDQIESPSKVYAKYGSYVAQGYAKGIEKSTGMVLQAVKYMTEAGHKEAEIINSEINSAFSLDSISDPVIRPVVDLSNVKMGANSIASMFNRNKYALNVAGSIPTAGLSSKNVILNIGDITVDGAQNPKEFADEFVQELEIQARTM